MSGQESGSLCTGGRKSLKDFIWVTVHGARGQREDSSFNLQFDDFGMGIEGIEMG